MCKQVPLCRLFSAASSDSIRFHSNLLSHENDLRVSIDNTCTDSLVTALDDEALLINDYMNDMSKSKVNTKLWAVHGRELSYECFFRIGPFRRRVPLRDTERGASTESTDNVRETIVKFPEKPAAGMVPANRQPPGNETVWQQKGTR